MRIQKRSGQSDMDLTRSREDAKAPERLSGNLAARNRRPKNPAPASSGENARNTEPAAEEIPGLTDFHIDPTCGGESAWHSAVPILKKGDRNDRSRAVFR